MLGLGATELVLILGIVGLLFGANRLPRLGAGLGEGIRNFRTGLRAAGELPDKAGDAAADPESRAPATAP